MYQGERKSVKQYSDTVMEFGGLNRLPRGNENEFSDEVNISSRDYPLISPRKRRVTAFETDGVITSLQNKEAFIWIEYKASWGHSRLFINGSHVTNVLDDSAEVTAPLKRKIVGMGAYIVIFPDKRYLNLLDYSDKGSLENQADFSESTAENPISFIPCTREGVALDVDGKASATAPTNPVSGQVWVDTSGETSVYKKWDSGTAQWVQMSTTYFMISYPGVETGFKQWDVVTLSGFHYGSGRIDTQVRAINSDGAIIYNVLENGLVFAGIIDRVVTAPSTKVIIKRKTPDMDFIVESNNRLWGCKYGVVGGKTVNEIYACRQGDFKNWFAYIGISTDSYAVSVGSEGQFTGAAVYNKCPVFFKESAIHMIYGSTPSSYQTVDIKAEGVQRGMGDSVCSAEGVVYYKGPTGIFAFSGSLPQRISRKLGEIDVPYIIGAGVGDKLYFAMGEKEGSKTIYTYDTYYGVWHKEDERDVRDFSRDGHLLYMLINEDGKYKIVSATDETDVDMYIGGSEPQTEEDINWSLESTEQGFSDIDMKYVKKLVIRARLSEGAYLRIYLSCDGEAYREVGQVLHRPGTRSELVNVVPRRCETFKYKLEGKGDVQVVSVYKEFIKGSDKP